jgi:hypothetical protein
MFGSKKDLEKGEALIVDRHLKRGHGGSGQNDLWEWAADVTVPGKAPFRTVLDEPNLGLDFREPDQGNVVGVLVDPKTNHAKFDKSDPRLSLKAARATKTDHFQEVLDGAPGTSPGGSPGPSVVLDGGVQVISATDAAPFLQDILSGDPQAKAAALAGLQASTAGAPTDAAVPGSGTVPARLAQLQQLKDAGALDEGEFQAQRQRILDSL